MLAITSASAGKKHTCVPNVLPCKVQHSGVVNASPRYWSPEQDTDGKQTAYFRGRKLRGTTLAIPQGYKGAVIEKTTQKLPRAEKKAPQPDTRQGGFDEEDDACDAEQDEAEEDVMIAREVASFDHIVVWGHEVAPSSADDAHAKAIQEYMSFAQAMHSY